MEMIIKMGMRGHKRSKIIEMLKKLYEKAASENNGEDTQLL